MTTAGGIASLSTFARVNDYGFIETPYRVVDDGRVTEEVKFLSALDEERLAMRGVRRGGPALGSVCARRL